MPNAAGLIPEEDVSAQAENLKRGDFKQKNTAQAGELGRDQYAANFRAI